MSPGALGTIVPVELHILLHIDDFGLRVGKMAGPQLSDQDESVKQRAVDNIMKLINSQLALEKKQAKMDAKVRASVWRIVASN
jgi:hypothetical protein